MSLQLSKPWTDTPITGYTAQKLTLAPVNFGVDWAEQYDSSKEAQIVNLTCPLDAAQKFKFARSEVANVYTNSGIDTNMMTPTKRGISVVCQLNSIVNVVDTDNAAFKQQLPISAHVVLKVPNNELITAAFIKEYLERTLSGLFETGSDGTLRISGLIRGSLTPADVN